MSDGKIYITISDSRNGSGGGVSPDVSNGGGQEKEENVLAKYVQHRFFNFIESQAKQFVNYSVNNIGNFTGNYQAQRDTEVMLSAASFAINLGTSIYAGVKMTGSWVGGVIAGALSLGSKAIEIGYREYSESFENRKVNYNINMMRKRLGLEGLTDGSRTGGY